MAPSVKVPEWSDAEAQADPQHEENRLAWQRAKMRTRELNPIVHSTRLWRLQSTGQLYRYFWPNEINIGSQAGWRVFDGEVWKIVAFWQPSLLSDPRGMTWDRLRYLCCPSNDVFVQVATMCYCNLTHRQIHIYNGRVGTDHGCGMTFRNGLCAIDLHCPAHQVTYRHITTPSVDSRMKDLW